MNYDDYEEAIKALRECRKYAQRAHDDAEAKHDSYGEFYMGSVQYQIMCETNDLLEKIDVIL